MVCGNIRRENPRGPAFLTQRALVGLCLIQNPNRTTNRPSLESKSESVQDESSLDLTSFDVARVRSVNLLALWPALDKDCHAILRTHFCSFRCSTSCHKRSCKTCEEKEEELQITCLIPFGSLDFSSITRLAVFAKDKTPRKYLAASAL